MSEVFRGLEGRSPNELHKQLILIHESMPDREDPFWAYVVSEASSDDFSYDLLQAQIDGEVWNFRKWSKRRDLTLCRTIDLLALSKVSPFCQDRVFEYFDFLSIHGAMKDWGKSRENMINMFGYRPEFDEEVEPIPSLMELHKPQSEGIFEAKSALVIERRILTHAINELTWLNKALNPKSEEPTKKLEPWIDFYTRNNGILLINPSDKRQLGSRN